MRTICRASLMAVLVFGCGIAARAQTQPQTPTVDDIVDKSLAASGGRAALGKLTSRLTTGTMTISSQGGEFTGTIEVLNQAPNKVRFLAKIDLSSVNMGMVVVDQRFDGTAGYALDSMLGDHAITGNQLEGLRSGAIFPTPLLDYKEHGTRILLGGKEKVGERDGYALSITPAGGAVVRLFVDAESYLPIRTVTNVDVPQFGTVEQTTDFADYREVDGVKLPFRLTNTSSVQNFTIVVTKVEHNVKVDPSLFVKPADK
jgi:outer membrane lipoprotein-sorting protein